MAATICAAMAPAANAESLIFATTNAEQHPINQGFLVPWAARINAEAGGAVELDVRHGPMMANHTNFYDRVVDDVVQISWGMTVFNPGRFPRTLVSTLPFMVDSAEQGAVALCAMYERGAFGEEFSDIVPLLFVEFPQASLHLKDSKLASIADVDGKKIITSSPAAGAVVAAFGGAPMSFNITEQYEALQRGAANGTVMNFTAFPAFRLNEVTTDHYVAPLGGAMGMVFMAKGKWEALSDEARSAITKHSGCEGTRAFGQFVDGWEAKSVEMVKASGDHTITYASDADVQALADKLAPGIQAGFASKVPNGAGLIEMFREELANAAK
ncbi:MAG: TRAP-type C4-dicarboxylate transport system substrate-binding protein [Halocynthiibacter sp.]|jgi:TRAP-type C4-dicarboxylate transport system substrate-binding protein